DATVFFHIEQVPQCPLFRVIRAGGISSGRPDTAVLFADQVLSAELLGFTVTPFITRAFVKVLGKSLCQAVSKGLGHNGVVVVVVGLEFPAEFFDTKTCSDSKRSYVVWQRNG